MAFGLLVLALVAIYDREALSAGWFGLIGFAAALMGTFFMTGDWWYEAFAVPRIAEVVPEVIPTFVGGRLLMGGLTSFVLLGHRLGPVRSRQPASSRVSDGHLGHDPGRRPPVRDPHRSCLSEWWLILGLAIGWLGVWLMRTTIPVSDSAQQGVAPAA